MKLTTITVSYGETQSLPEYSNVKPSITLGAVLDELDDPSVVEALLWEQARQAVRDQIDAALELNGKSAKYSTEPRYQIVQTNNDPYGRNRDNTVEYVAIIPDTIDHRAFGATLVHAVYPESRNLRLAHAQRAAEQHVRERRNHVLIDCSNGNLEPLRAAMSPPAEADPEANPDYAPTPESEF